MRKNLKEARQKAGMTQQQMADTLGISIRYYQNIETGDRAGSFYIWKILLVFINGNSERLKKIIPSKEKIYRYMKNIPNLDKYFV